MLANVHACAWLEYVCRNKCMQYPVEDIKLIIIAVHTFAGIINFLSVLITHAD